MAGTVIPMDKRLAMIAAGELAAVCVSDLCAELGISRQSYYRLRARWRKDGAAGLEPYSKRPAHSPNQIPVELEDQIVRLRQDLPLDNGAQSIAYALARAGQRVPALSTIHRALVRHGLVVPAPHKRPRQHYRSFEAAAPNERWQLDGTGWRLAGGQSACIMDVLDDHSRLAVDGRVGGTETGALAWEAFSCGAAQFGLPAGTLSDNGSAFTGRVHGGVADFERDLAALGVATCFSSPGHPRTCGKVERYHRTKKAWLRTQPLACTYSQLQRQDDTFRAYYNEDRPHRALRGATPAERWAASPRAVPAVVPLPLDGFASLEIAPALVSSTGVIAAGRVTVHLGTQWAGAALTVVRYTNRVLVLHGAQLVRGVLLDDDPNHRYYGSGTSSGGPRRERLVLRS